MIDGQAAVDLYRKAKEEDRPFTVVVMDLTIPGGMGGKEAISLLKQIDPNVRAIVSSGYSKDPVLANFRNFGFCAVVAKPYDVAHLAAVIERVLSQRS